MRFRISRNCFLNFRLFIRGKFLIYRGGFVKNSSRYYINIKYFLYLLRDKFFNISLGFSLAQVRCGRVDSFLKMKYYVYFIL